jgi:ABC-type uncharacterized transport system substrate-binding protein
MERRPFVVGIAAVMARPLAAGAQQAGKVWRVGYLSNSGGQDDTDAAFIRGLRDLGYAEGRNISIKGHYSGGRVDSFTEAAAALVASGVDMLVAWGPPATIAARRATDSIPIIGIAIGSPVEMAWVGNVAQPSGNLTGLLLFPADESSNVKRLELLREAVPAATRVGALSTPASAPDVVGMTRLRAAATALKTEVEIFNVNSPSDFEATFAEMKNRGIRGVLVLPDAILWSYRADVVRMAEKMRLPTAYWSRDYVEIGGFFSYAASLSDLGRRAAIYVDKIIKGSKPRDLPVEQPTKFELVINARTARSLNLTIPPSLLVRADQVIE